MKNENLRLFFCGRLTVRADGPFTERFINICTHRGIKIYDIKRCGTSRIFFTTDVNSFLHIRQAVRRTHSHLTIVGRHGLPFVLKKFKHRKPLSIGMLICCFILWYTSTHILGITVYGNFGIDTQTIKDALKDCGLSPGVKTSEVKPDSIRNKMMTNFSELAWIGINANGSRAYVEIVERSPKDEGVDKNAPACNLVASKDGEIEKLEVRAGQSVVNIGSGVRKGDVLVSGITDNNLNGFDYVHSRGEVIAKTYYKRTKSYPMKFTENIKTGKFKHRLSVELCNKEIPIFKSLNMYKNYETESSVYEYKIPVIEKTIRLNKETYAEVIPSDKTLSISEALDIGKNELADEIKSNLSNDAEIIEENTSYTLTELNTIQVTLEIVCRENIAEEFIIEVPLTQ